MSKTKEAAEKSAYTVVGDRLINNIPRRDGEWIELTAKEAKYLAPPHGHAIKPATTAAKPLREKADEKSAG